MKITCEVCPHHLFMTKDDLHRIGSGRAQVRPNLVSRDDQAALWENLDWIDSIATDHAPHTAEEKNSAKPPPGFPGNNMMILCRLTSVQEI